MNPVVIGISGYANAGKDTLADLLVEHFRFSKLAFADPMREMAMAIDPVVGYAAGEDGEDVVIRYSDAVAQVGYQEAKSLYPEIRRFLQRLGTDAGRKILGEDVWVDSGIKRAEQHPRAVFADLRFTNEAQAIRRREGLVFRVNRPGFGPANDHESEVGLDGWRFDASFNNNDTIESLLPRLEQVFSRMRPEILRTT